MSAGDDLADPSPTSVSASLGVSFGADGAGGVTAISYTGPALTSATVPLAYAFNDATDTLTATAGAKTVFTLVVDEVAGTWTFTLLDHLDHPTGVDEEDEPRSFSRFNAATEYGDGRGRRCGDSGAVGGDMSRRRTCRFARAATLAVDGTSTAPPAVCRRTAM